MNLNKNISTILSECETNFRILADKIPDIIWTALPDGYVDFVNNIFEENTGLSAEGGKGFEWQKIVCPEDLGNLNRVWNDSLRKGVQYEIEARIRIRGGEL